MKQEIAKRELNFNQIKRINVYLKPCNEKQELNCFEDFTGTPEEIINRSLEIINGLQNTLPQSVFSMKIESPELEQTLYLDSDMLFDKNFNEIGNVRDFIHQ